MSDLPSGTAARRARQAEARRATGTAGRPAPGAGPERRPTGGELDPDALAALEEERDFLLRSLRDLEREHEAGDVDDHDYEQLNDDYTARAADVLRAIEDRRALLVRTAPPDRGRRVLITVLVGLFAVVAGCTVAQAAGRRGVGDEITGDIRQSSRDKIFEAQQAMGAGRYLDAINLYDEAIAAAPSEPEAHAYKGWLLALSAKAAGGADRELLLGRAVAELDKAVELAPDYPDARVFRASTYGDVGRPADGLADLDRLRPGSVPPDLQARVAQLRARLTEQAATARPPAPAG